MGRQSILDYFCHNAEHRGGETAALVKDNGAFSPVSWKQMQKRTWEVAQGLIDRGVQPGDRVALMMQTRIEWVLADLAIAAAGAISVPIYGSNLADECQYIVENSGAVAVICEDAGQARKFFEGDKLCAPLRLLVQLTGSVEAPLPVDAVAASALGCCTWNQLIAGVRVDEAHLATLRGNTARNSPFSIIYTSGTTGRPKGVVSTHDNMLYEAEAIEQIEVLRQDDVELLILPLAHVFARALEIAWIGIGHVMAFGESMKTVREDMALSRPHVMAGVPRVFEKFYQAVVARATAQPNLTAKMFTRASAVASERGELLMAGKTPNALMRAEFALWNKTVFAKIGRGLQESMGGRMRMLVSGGGPLSTNIAWFFAAAGVQVLEGFGLTESMAATCLNRPGHNRIGTVGLPMPGTQAKLAADGELLLRGRSITPGYWQNPQATAEAIEEGWLKTGDVAQIDPDGSIRIVDRKKDLIVTAGGKNVAPQNIENALKGHPLISQVVVHGDRRPFLTALITLDPDNLQAFAKEHHLGNGSYAELAGRPEVLQEIEQVMVAHNAQLARYETIKKYQVMPADFTIESGELTPSMKIKRKVINARYASVFDGFYAR